MTQVSDPNTTAATAARASDPLAEASTAWQKFVAAFAANNQGAAAVERAQAEVSAAQAALAEAQGNYGTLKAAVGRAFADLETYLELLGIQLPAPSTAIPNPPTTTEESGAVTAPIVESGSAAGSAGATEEAGNPVVVDTITGVHVPVDEEGSPIPVPPIPDVTAGTETEASAGASEGASEEAASGGEAGSSDGTAGTDPNAGSGEEPAAASNITDATTGSV